MNQSRSTKLCYYFFFLGVWTVLGTCVAQTPRDCPAHEVYLECGANCQTECATLSQTCLIVHKRCPDGCYCSDGYARDATGTCVPIAQCSKY